MPLVQTRGAASAQGFGEFAQASAVNYIEDVFSCFLYTGGTGPQSITNGIDLAGKGGLVWIKGRGNVINHALWDSNRGVGQFLNTNTTDANTSYGSGITAFNANGFSLGNDAVYDVCNTSYASPFASWTFRKQPKFFDVVTYTGAGDGTTVSHNLGSTPGCVIVKATSGVDGWFVYHKDLLSAPPTNRYLRLDKTDATAFLYSWISVSDTTITFPTAYGPTASGGTSYVAYLFAHDAGGFGLSGTDNVISCGSYTGTGATGNNVTLGYEPQWLMIKAAERAQDWFMFDVMRGMTTTGGTEEYLLANTADAAGSGAFGINPTATGFGVNTAGTSFNASGEKYIYIAIRRGPMKVPTLGTSVFGLSARTGTGANATVTGGQTDDAVIVKNRGSAVASLFSSRLTGTGYLVTSSTAAEVAAGATILQANPWDVMDGVKVGTTSTITNASGSTFINYLFKRAPSFFDEVCYVGNSTVRTLNHNLGVVPELIIVRGRNITPINTNGWTVYTQPTGNTNYMYLNSQDAAASFTGYWNDTSPTASVFTLGTGNADDTNATGKNFVAYLFSTCAGVSKVGSYTGYAGYTVTVPCGFTAGVRFVLIKRTDSTGDWWVYDSARGITSGNDPYLYLNTTAAEVGGTDYIDSYSAGFEVTSTAPAGLNATGGTYIFLAIA